MVPQALEGLLAVAVSVTHVPTCLSTQDNNGVIGLLEPMKPSSVPVQLQLGAPVVKIVSGEPGPGVHEAVGTLRRR